MQLVIVLKKKCLGWYSTLQVGYDYYANLISSGWNLGYF